MPEQQNIEYKQSWHDDYLKWVCGFANAQGGVIFIGKDDDGKIVGVDDSKKLMEDLPNKIRNTMGISAEVNLHEEKASPNDTVGRGKHFIEIVTHPYSVPISIRGRYYYRSGSTKQELIGTSLNEFLLKKSGKTWDDVVEPRASFEDIDCAVLEVTNTPWKQRLRYPIALSTETDREGIRCYAGRVAKALHVSPFLDESHEYLIRLRDRGAGSFSVSIDVIPHGANEPTLVTELRVERRPVTRSALSRALFSEFAPTHRVSFGIHAQAVRLWLKRVPFVPHPSKRRQRRFPS